MDWVQIGAYAGGIGTAVYHFVKAFKTKRSNGNGHACSYSQSWRDVVDAELSNHHKRILELELWQESAIRAKENNETEMSRIRIRVAELSRRLQQSIEGNTET